MIKVADTFPTIKALIEEVEKLKMKKLEISDKGLTGNIKGKLGDKNINISYMKENENFVITFIESK